MWPWKDIIVKSKINGEIKVKFFFGRPSVWVGGYQQSGPLVKQIWQRALKNINFPKKVLILGLGCGVAAKLLPESDITGIEIDPVMINLGKKYFGLDKITNLKVIQGDAIKEIRRLRQKYDLIIVDMYLGGDIVIEKIKWPGKKVVINLLTFQKNNDEIFKLKTELQEKLTVYKITKTEFNELFFCVPRD